MEINVNAVETRFLTLRCYYISHTVHLNKDIFQNNLNLQRSYISVGNDTCATPTDNLELPFYRTRMSLDCGRRESTQAHPKFTITF